MYIDVYMRIFKELQINLWYRLLKFLDSFIFYPYNSGSSKVAANSNKSIKEVFSYFGTYMQFSFSPFWSLR